MENKKSIVKKIMYATDMIIYVQKYIEKMDKYYLDESNNERIDTYALEEYINFKKECEKGAKERGLI